MIMTAMSVRIATGIIMTHARSAALRTRLVAPMAPQKTVICAQSHPDASMMTATMVAKSVRIQMKT
jgi:hypothetical protein